MLKHIHKKTILANFLIVIAIVCLGYPKFAETWNEQHKSEAMASYMEVCDTIGPDETEEKLNEAEEYNESLPNDLSRFEFTDEDEDNFNQILWLNDNGMIGTVNIPSINVDLPIMHGTDTYTLSQSAGLLEGSSFPIGGKGTHAVITAHSGLANATLFTNLACLQIGDVFSVTVLNQKCTYEVDNITKVLPEEMEELAFDEDQDYCSLVTCTPIGVNSHRLIVRGHRIPNEVIDEETGYPIEVTENTVHYITLEDGMFYGCVALCVFYIGFYIPYSIVSLIKNKRKKRLKKLETKEDGEGTNTNEPGDERTNT